jgi:TRAP-type transport system periplasmic protein
VKRPIRRLVGAVAISLSVVACGGTTSTSATPKVTFTLKLAFESAAGDLQDRAAQRFKTALEQATNKQVIVQLFPGGQLGTDAQLFQQMQTGTIQGYIGPSGQIGSAIPDVGILDLPYLFTNEDAEDKTLAGTYGKKLDGEAEAKGLHVIGWWPAGVRDLYNNVRPVVEPTDLKGLRIRILNSPVFVATFKAFGAIPTNIAFPEVYLALKNGTLDGAETAYASAIAAKQQEVFKYASPTGHQITFATFMLNKQWWDSVPQSLQGAIQKAADNSTAYETSIEKTSRQNSINTLKADGITMVQPDLKAFQTTARTVWPQFFAAYGKDNINAILKSEGQATLP